MCRRNLFPKEGHRSCHKWKSWQNLNIGTGHNFSRPTERSYKTHDFWTSNFAYLSRGSGRHRSAWTTTAEHCSISLHVDLPRVCATASACSRVFKGSVFTLLGRGTKSTAQSRHPSPISVMQGRPKHVFTEGYFVNHFWKTFPQKYFTFSVELRSWKHIQPLLGKEVSEHNSNGLSVTKSTRPCHLLFKWGFDGILPSCSYPPMAHWPHGSQI